MTCIAYSVSYRLGVAYALPKNIDRRTREYLTPAEVTQLMQAARHVGRHGLRVSEVASLRWESIDLKTALLHVHRLKHAVAATHPLHGPELRALRKLQHASPELTDIFLSERGSPLSDRTICHRMLRAGIDAQLPFPVHPHMLRHACGFYLANKGIDTRAMQQYLGHRHIQHTGRYTELAPSGFVISGRTE